MNRVTRQYLVRHGIRKPPDRCFAGHDILADETTFIYVDGLTMRWRCRICVAEKNRVESVRRKARPKNGGDRPCLHCGKPFSGNPNRRTCSEECRRAILRTKCGRQPVRDESFLLVQSMALLDLMEERERCATHWERAEVDARIAQVRARK